MQPEKKRSKGFFLLRLPRLIFMGMDQIDTAGAELGAGLALENPETEENQRSSSNGRNFVF